MKNSAAIQTLIIFIALNMCQFILPATPTTTAEDIQRAQRLEQFRTERDKQDRLTRQIAADQRSLLDQQEEVKTGLDQDEQPQMLATQLQPRKKEIKKNAYTPEETALMMQEYRDMLAQQEKADAADRARRNHNLIEYTEEDGARLIARLPEALKAYTEKYLGPHYTFLNREAIILQKKILAYPSILQWPWCSNDQQRVIAHPHIFESPVLCNHDKGSVYLVEKEKDGSYPPRHNVDIFDRETNTKLCMLRRSDLCTPHFSDANLDKTLLFTLTHCIDGGIPYIDIWDSCTGNIIHRLKDDWKRTTKNISMAPDNKSVLATHINGTATLFQVLNYDLEFLIRQKNAEILRERAKRIPLISAVAMQEINRDIAYLKCALKPADHSRIYDHISKTFRTGKKEARIALAADIGFGGLPSHY